MDAADGAPGKAGKGPPSPATPTGASSRFSFSAMAAALPKADSPRRGSPKSSAKPAAPSPTPSGAKKTLAQKVTGPPPRQLPAELFILLSDAAFRVANPSSAPLFHNDKQLSKCFVAADDAAALGLCVGDTVVLEPERWQASEDGAAETPVKDGAPLVAMIWPSPAVQSPNAVLSDAAVSNSAFQSGARIRLSRYTGTPLCTAIKVTAVVAEDTQPSRPLDPLVTVAVKAILAGTRFLRPNMAFTASSRGQSYHVALKDISAAGSPASPSETLLFSARDTELQLLLPTPAAPAAGSDAPNVDFSHVGGLDEQIAVMRDMVQVPLIDPSRFTRFGLRPPRGILITGPSGTGKTLLARAVAGETGAHVVAVKGGDVLSKFYGETEARLRAIFEEAVQNSPSIIFIDDIDTLCSKRDDSSSELDKRVVAALLTLMDGVTDLGQRPDSGLHEPPRVVVIGATSRPSSLDEALRRPGRFDRELELPIPTPAARLGILRVLLRNTPCDATEEQLADIAARTHGYVGADLATLVREAGLRAVKRGAKEGTPPGELRVRASDLDGAAVAVRPSAMREILLEVPKVRWEDIGGQNDVKHKMREAIEWPLKHPEAFARLGIRPPKGILMYGPPGCSKTLMAKALATESGLNFLAVKGPELFSKWVGESEKAVREVFRKARAASPSIVFFDEIDALATARSSGDSASGSSVGDRVLSQLLTEMDGIEPLVNVTVVAATNRPDVLDPALMRPGRLDRILYVGPPDLASRREIFRISTRRMACEEGVDVDELAQRSEGLSGAECVNVCQEAAMLAMEEDVAIRAVGKRHFDQALREVRPRITPEVLAFYERFRLGQS
ncbi:P-loop containing nucleoside triphosphate hydrolase protein [Hyaloraphidium curvatum]|nr:P-loop containing nucleoside triphosphate hydrolase protein [Hyaloraphidium curvatum]